MDATALRMRDGRNRLRLGPPAGRGLERFSARLYGPAFSPHRHDTYAIGLTVAGVQSFRFRGTSWHCLPGECHILHPDELHDGVAGTDEGFGYHMLYVDPARVQDALGGRALPFVATPVVDAGRLFACGVETLWNDDADGGELGEVEVVAAVVDLLTAAAAQPARPRALAYEALARVRDRIADAPGEGHSAAALERLAGLSRWELARQFRAAFGTSPSRFRVLRRLDLARRLLAAGMPIAGAALHAGFADQSHMTRHFKRTYGLTPAAFATALA